MDANVKEKAAKIRLLLMDVDGVWTDGNLFYVPGPGGEMVEAKQSNAQDGMGLRWAHASGLESGLISGRDSPGVTHRAEMLGITYIYQGYLEKIPPYEEICRAASVSDDQVAYLGDDLTDIPLIDRVGLGVAVANARPEVKKCADYTTQTPGGSGAIREVIELIMRSRGTWEQILDKYGVR
tara:strand:+ start:2372 stop:2914 length:543 start_codon:yes stop_codon:yes gene_type:complete